MGDRSVVFGTDLVALFAAASHDRNPLHTSVEYARATAYGRPIVFGVLAGLIVLAGMPTGGRRIRRVGMSFLHPVFAGKRYTVATIETASTCRGELRSAGRPVAIVTVTFASGEDHVRRANVEIPAQLTPMRYEPADWSASHIQAGLAVRGRYQIGAITELIMRSGMRPGTLPDTHVAALLWGSYLAGMQLPGRQALLHALTVDLLGENPASDHWYEAEVRSVDQRFGLVHVSGRLSAGSAPVAEVELQAFIRPAAASIEPAAIRAALHDVPQAPGRTAVVIGASRGLGAATALALAGQGCNVVGCYQVSRTRADQVARSALPLPISMVRGDAASADFCADLARKVLAWHGRVDMLICSASPALLPMRLLPGSADAHSAYIAEAVRLVATPVGSFLPLLEQVGGQVLVVSSQMVKAPAADLPHYVAAKGALEYLVRALVPAHPKVRFLVARPPHMDTDYFAPLITGEPPISPVAIAAELTRQLIAPRNDRQHILEIHDLTAVPASPGGSCGIGDIEFQEQRS